MSTIDSRDLIGPREALAYYDSQSIDLPRAVTPLEAWNLMMAQAQPVLRWAFRVRDTISAWFGVRKIGGFTGRRHAEVKVGDRLDFFLVEGARLDALLLTARDRHLDVMTGLHTDGTCLTITSSVIVHNLFGRAYMVPVGPAHRVIVRVMLRRLRRSLMEAG